jgi:hypothetical protein
MTLGLNHAVGEAHSIKLTVAVDDVNSEYDDDGFGLGNPSDVHELDRQTRSTQIAWSAQYHPSWTSELALSHTTQELEDRQNGALKTGDTATVVFDFTKAPGQSFGLDDVQVVGGSLSDLQLVADTDGKRYTATIRSLFH